MNRPSRFRTPDDFRYRVPVHVVWELTLACDLKCLHCGSRAGRKRPNELTTAECLDIIQRLATLGTREISLIGGEAYLRSDWLELIREIRSLGMYCAMQSGAKNLTRDRLRKAVDAGLQGLGVSLDGLRPLHDELRGVEGSFDAATMALANAHDLGLRTSVNTQIGARTIADLRELMGKLIQLHATHWQLQLTVAMGNAVDNDHLLLQPYELLNLMPLIADLYHEALDEGLLIAVGNNIGYFGPYEHFLRGHADSFGHWSGCSAGQTVMGIEADGTIKGCPSLPTHRYAAGNVRDLSLDRLWLEPQIAELRSKTTQFQPWGFCANCYYSEACRGGCTWTADALFGRPGNNPYCHYRALKLADAGLRETVVKTSEASRSSFGTGRFEIVVEQETANGWAPLKSQSTLEPANNSSLLPLTALTWPSAIDDGSSLGPSEVFEERRELIPCGQCNNFVWDDEATCVHCGSDTAAAATEKAAEDDRRAKLIEQVTALLATLD